MANDRPLVVAVATAIWIGLAGVIWLALRDEDDATRSALLAVSIVALAAGTAHAVIAAHGWRGLGFRRWPTIVGLVLVCGTLSHAVLVRLGMTQSLTQDLINMTVISGVALAVSQAWSGQRARQALVAEAAGRARAEARLAQVHLRPAGLVAVKVGNGERMVDPAMISRIQADGNFTILHDRSGPIFVSESMKAIVERLRPYGFVRVHKSHAVNAEAVRERRRHAVVLADGVTVAVGRAYRAQDEGR